MPWFAATAAVLAGVLIGLQSAVNAQLGGRLGQPLVAALASFTIGGTALLLTCLGLRVPLADVQPAAVPWWAWTGGLLGAIFVTAQTTLPARLGVTVFVVLVVSGQLVASLVVDRFGLLGMEARPFTLAQVLGVGLLLAAVVLIRG